MPRIPWLFVSISSRIFSRAFRSDIYGLADDFDPDDIADRGQGLNNAILDAAHFARRIAEMKSKTRSALRQAVSEYEKELWVRGSEAVPSSNENSLSVHNWAELQNSPLFKAGLQQKVPTKEPWHCCFDSCYKRSL